MPKNLPVSAGLLSIYLSIYLSMRVEQARIESFLISAKTVLRSSAIRELAEFRPSWSELDVAWTSSRGRSHADSSLNLDARFPSIFCLVVAGTEEL